MRTFVINGAIVDNDSQKESFEDLTPVQIISFLNKLDEGEDIEVQINSLGGSVFAGLQIYNALRNASKNGHKVITHCTSIAASIASIIFFAGDEMIMDSNSFLCIHLPWTSGISGNAIDIRKEADTLDKICSQMIDIYSKHMNISKEEIKSYLEKETWICASDMTMFGVHDVVINNADEAEYRIAASIANKFKNVPKDLIMENKEEIKETIDKTEEVVVDSVVKSETDEEKKEETETTDEPKKTVEELEEELQKLIDENEQLKAELDKKNSETVEERLAKCQSTFQNKINGFKDEIKAKDEELQKFKDSVSSLTTELENTKKELHDMSAAFKDKENALANLNAGVLRPSEELPTFNDGLDKCKTLMERVAFINSGKYTK